MNNAPEPLTPIEIRRALRALEAGDVPSHDVLQRALLMALMAPVLNDLNTHQRTRIAVLESGLRELRDELIVGAILNARGDADCDQVLDNLRYGVVGAQVWALVQEG